MSGITRVSCAPRLLGKFEGNTAKRTSSVQRARSSITLRLEVINWVARGYSPDETWFCVLACMQRYK